MFLSVSTGAVADLHLHSTASDGSDAPAAVVRRAKEAGFGTIAIADHDTMDGVGEALTAGEQLGIEVIPAVEYSTLDGDREIHMLGYGLDHDDPTLRSQLARLRDGRLNRAQHMVENLNALGYPVRWERVRELAGDDNVGRPHIAKAMVEAGIINEVKDAFTEQFISSRGRAYVERVKVTPEEAISQIRAAGGVPILAHPGRFRADDDTIEDDVIERYISAGLGGIEVFYSRHTPVMQLHYATLAERRGLLQTGGSDDHGAFGEQALLGRVRLPYEYVERLKAAITRAKRARAAGFSTPRLGRRAVERPAQTAARKR
jgi:3',5'-nucleoside bisphosphate phosphatase